MGVNRRNSNAEGTKVNGNDEKRKAAAFVNWKIKRKDGAEIKSSKGFPIWQDERYPNAKEDFLVDLAKKNGGRIRVMMLADIMVHNGEELGEANIDDFEIIEE